MNRRYTFCLLIVAILGIAVSVYALYLHTAPTGDTFCNINATFNCDIVNKGEHAEIGQIPVAVFGIIGYAVLALGALVGFKQKDVWPFLLVSSLIGLVFALYLTFIEAFVLRTYCLVCLASQVLILAAFILSLLQYRYVRHHLSGSGTMGKGIPGA